MSTAAQSESKATAVAHHPAAEFPALHNPHLPISHAAAHLEPYLKAIIAKTQPARIILFGSYAYGTPTEHSDFDILVIRGGIASSRASNLELRRAIWDVVAPPASFTFLSETPDGLASKLRSGSFIYREIVENGVEVYAA